MSVSIKSSPGFVVFFLFLVGSMFPKKHFAAFWTWNYPLLTKRVLIDLFVVLSATLKIEATTNLPQSTAWSIYHHFKSPCIASKELTSNSIHSLCWLAKLRAINKPFDSFLVQLQRWMIVWFYWLELNRSILVVFNWDLWFPPHKV